MHSKVIKLPANRVRRNYLGGLLLDQLAGIADARDGDTPEDWLGSTAAARNPGLPEVLHEGLATAELESGPVLLRDLFAADGEYYLGAAHLVELGTNLGFLAKLLDSSMRLHLQAHPTAAYAREHLNSRWGKLETYYILGVRPGCEGYIWLGFQHAPTPAEWRRIVLEQDMPAMQACFEKVPVLPGQVWRIPGGMPHAIGEGLFVLEVMEPTDWVVRCEFERDGIIVPPEARFMGMDPAAALEIFDLSERSVEQICRECSVTPRLLAGDTHGELELLIGPTETECFSIRRLIVRDHYALAKAELIYIGVVTRGAGRVRVEHEELEVSPGSTFLLPAAVSEVEVDSVNPEPLEVLFCSPGYHLEELPS